MKARDRQAIVFVLRRFGWLFLMIFATMTLGQWSVTLALPDAIGQVTDYTVTSSLIFALTFGGLYAAWSVLRPEGPSGTASR